MVKPNERLGNYEVASAADGTALVLGSGAGGVTYRGRHIHLGTEVAIKILTRRKNLLQKDRDAFLSEARSAASLNHPQIARILDFGESAQQHPYYVMELCEGGSLEEFGRKAGPPDEYASIQWLFEAAAALAHAHQKGILHRDIKPSNLLVARQNETATVKLIDFGLADHADPAAMAEQVIGTPHFAAPEQLRGQAEPASDVFSLGATFLWLLTGNHLSQGDVKSVISERLETTGYSTLLGSLPANWQQLLGRMLEVDPARRLRDGGEVLGVLPVAFPNHPGHPVAWDASAEFPGAATKPPAPSQWQDFPDAAWMDRWLETRSPVGIEHGVAVLATRPGAVESFDVFKFIHLDPEIAEVLTHQGDLVATYAAELGLGHLILERGADWHAVAWPALGSHDALSWVRQGQSAPIADVLTALDPIASALDAMKSGGFEHIEIHPSMLIVSVAVPQDHTHASVTRDPRDLWEPDAQGGTPLKFSLAVPLPVLESTDHASDSGGTMRGATGAGLSARFASCVYQLLSGRTPSPAAFVNSRAYQAIPKLTEKSNRFLSSAIAGTIGSGSCRDVIRGLAHEERLPGASYSGALASTASASGRSNPALSMPAPAAPAIPPSRPPAIPNLLVAAPEAKAGTPPPLAPPSSPPSKPPVAAIMAAAAVVILALAAGGWFIFKKPPPPIVVDPHHGNSFSLSSNSTVTDPQLNRVPDPPELPGSIPPLKELVQVPEDASSITEALKLCQEGGTIAIAGGTYSEALVLTRSVSLVSKSTIVLEDRGLGTSLVTARGPIQVTMRNIQIKNTQREAAKDAESSPSLVLIADGAGVSFEGCVIEGSVGSGISLTDKASATFSNTRIYKNRGYGIHVSGASKVETSLSFIQGCGLSGITVLNIGSVVTLGGGTTVSENSRNGVEVASGGAITCTGTEIKTNQKVGLMVEGSGSLATLQASCVISENRKYGAGIRDSGRLNMTGGTVEENSDNGIYLESGGQAEIMSCRFKSNGTIGVYLVGGPTSSITIAKSEFANHSDAAIATVEGKALVTDCRFDNNPVAVYYGKSATGAATGNTVHPGPAEDAFVTEGAGEVTLQNNQTAP